VQGLGPQSCTQYNCEKWSCWANGRLARWCSRARNARARYCLSAPRALSLLPREDDAKYEVGTRENAVVENINHARASCAPLEHPLPLAHPHLQTRVSFALSAHSAARVVYASLQIELSVSGNLINFPSPSSSLALLAACAALVFATTRLFLCTLERISGYTFFAPNRTHTHFGLSALGSACFSLSQKRNYCAVEGSHYH